MFLFFTNLLKHKDVIYFLLTMSSKPSFWRKCLPGCLQICCHYLLTQFLHPFFVEQAKNFVNALVEWVFEDLSRWWQQLPAVFRPRTWFTQNREPVLPLSNKVN